MAEYLYNHFNKNKDSLLAKIFGIYTVKIGWYDPVHLILMANTIKFQDLNDIVYKFDLKGSSMDRYVKITKKTKGTTTLKDSNLLKLTKHNKRLLNFDH